MTHWMDLSQVYGNSVETSVSVTAGGDTNEKDTAGKIKLIAKKDIGHGFNNKHICIEDGCFVLGKYFLMTKIPT